MRGVRRRRKEELGGEEAKVRRCGSRRVGNSGPLEADPDPVVVPEGKAGDFHQRQEESQRSQESQQPSMGSIRTFALVSSPTIEWSQYLGVNDVLPSFYNSL